MPFQKLLEQTLLFRSTRRYALGFRARFESGGRELVELLLQCRIPRPAGDAGRQVHVLPLLVVAGLLLQALETLEDVIDEARDAHLLRRVRWRIRDGEHRWH